MNDSVCFLLVPDAASARRVRRGLAQEGTALGVVVGTWPELLSLAREAFLVPEVKVDWPAVVARAMSRVEQPFWAESLKTDPEGTLRAIMGTLREFLDACPPGTTLLKGKVSGLSERGQRHFNDLCRLQEALDGQLPADLAGIRAVLTAPAWLPLRAIRVQYLPGTPATAWQLDLLNRLNQDDRTPPPSPLWQNLLETSSDFPPRAGKGTALGHLQREYEDYHPSLKRAPLDDSLCFLGVRDELAEVEVVAGMIQRLLDGEPGLSAGRVGILLDGSPFRDRAVAEVFTRAGLPLSGLRRRSSTRDLVSEALGHFLRTRRVGASTMAMASLLSSPLWPWPPETGADLAMAAQDPRARRDRTIPPEVGLCGASELLLLLRDGRAQTPGELTAQLQAFLAALPTPEGEAQDSEPVKAGAVALLERVRSLPAGGEIPWEDLLRGIPQAGPAIGEGTEYWREGIAVSYEDREPERELDFLFVLGFAEGHFPPAPRLPVVLDDEDRRVLWQENGLRLPFRDDEVRCGQTRFFRHLRNVSRGCVFTVPLRDLAGKPRQPSGTLDLIAGMFAGIDSAEQLLRLPEREGDRGRIPGLALAPAAEPSPPRTVAVDDLELGLDLYISPDGTIRHDSPTRLEKMLVSPLAWLFDRIGVVPRSWAPEQCDPPTCGTIAHAVFEHLFAPGKELPSPEEVESRVRDLFSGVVGDKAPFLLGDEWSVERNRLAGEIARAATAWASILTGVGAHVVGAEQKLSGELSGIPISGQTDLLLRLADGRGFVVDYKKSSSAKRRLAMTRGWDLQASLYRLMLAEGGAGAGDARGPDGVLYYMMNDQTGLADAPFDHPAVDFLDGDISAEAMPAVKEGIARLRQGQVRLNREGDEKYFNAQGVGTYCLQDSPLIARFTLPADPGGDGGEP